VDLIFIAGQYPISTIIQPFLPLQSVEVPPASFQLGYDISVQTVHVVVTKRIILKKCNEPYDRAMQRNAMQSKASNGDGGSTCDSWRLSSILFYFYTFYSYYLSG
jgi:hypothetical protein